MTLEWGDRTPPSDFFLRFGKLSNDRPKVTQIDPQDLGKKPSSWGSGPVGTRILLVPTLLSLIIGTIPVNTFPELLENFSSAVIISRFGSSKRHKSSAEEHHLQRVL